MIQLRTLGGLDLSGPDGREMRAVLTQTKRLLLLTFLALRSRHGFIRRDNVVALFWPEQDGEHARAALRQAVRFLRKVVGAGTVTGRGDEELGLDPTALRCDAVEFDRLCDAGDWAAALELYRGELLSGVFVSDPSPGLERWLEAERERLRRRAVAAAWALVGAAEAAGDPVMAAPWARRAVELDPDDEAGVRRLIRILDRRGDRAGALGAYDAFRRRLRAEYGAAPSPETEALMAAVRARAERIWESPLQGWPPSTPP
jgi:DNA-binding SARP family transcriptional activator